MPEGLCFYQDAILITDSLTHRVLKYTDHLEVFAGTQVGYKDGGVLEA